MINNVEDFQNARKMIVRIITVLKGSGMRVNFDKSVVVLVLRGQAAAGIKQRYIKWRKGRYVLILGTDQDSGQDIILPVEDKMEYLGTILSYGALENQTVKSRAAQAWGNFNKLRQVLRTTSDFSLRQKLRIFRTCVVTALVYGVIGVGVSASSVRGYEVHLG